MKVTSLIISLILVSCSTAKPINPIQGPLDARQESYRQCYVESDSYKGRTDSTLGGLTVSFTITKEGKVKDSKIVSSDFKDANLHACILDQIRQITFPDIDTETIVNQPINFIPVKS